MATKIRLQRHGRKGYAYYPIVVADSRAPRDGRFIERIGSYNPNTNPATISLDFDRALYWVETGAEPTDTVRSILSKEGVMMMKLSQRRCEEGARSMQRKRNAASAHGKLTEPRRLMQPRQNSTRRRPKRLRRVSMPRLRRTVSRG